MIDFHTKTTFLQTDSDKRDCIDDRLFIRMHGFNHSNRFFQFLGSYGDFHLQLRFTGNGTLLSNVWMCASQRTPGAYYRGVDVRTQPDFCPDVDRSGAELVPLLRGGVMIQCGEYGIVSDQSTVIDCDFALAYTITASFLPCSRFDNRSITQRT